MWVKGVVNCILGLQMKYGVGVAFSTSQYDDFLMFKVTKGDFQIKNMLSLETVYAMGESDKFFEDTLEYMAKQVADAYESTSKSKAWNETLQEIGVREG